MKKKKNAFTLIELISVLVILASLALIVTPLVMNIVKKAKDSANKRSVDAYGKAVELAVTTYLLDNGEYPTDLNGLTIEYSGNEVVCNVKTLNEDGSIYLSECSVSGRDVKDSSTEDGFYHYGKTTSSAYQAYSVGDIVTYNGMNFYVIENSDENTDYVALLKSELLTVDEINSYAMDGSGVNHVNRYTSSYKGNAYDINGLGYGGMAYYSSETCGYPNGSFVGTGCTTEYEQSEVKIVVDNWAADKLNVSELKEDNLGYKVRLLTIEDLTTNLGYSIEDGISSVEYNSEVSPEWIHVPRTWYWTMSLYDNSKVWYVYTNNEDNSSSGVSGTGGVYAGGGGYYFGVRPVINLKKSAI